MAVEESPTVEASADGWQTVTSAEGRFTVEMPGEPQVDQSSMNTPQGDVTIHSWVVAENGPEYTLMYVDYPEDAAAMDPMTLLRGAINGIARDNKVVSDEETTVSGKPAIAAEVEGPGGNPVFLRVLMSENRMYQLLVATSQEGKEMFRDDAQRFFDSFTLTE
jgi:hypothetical protein